MVLPRASHVPVALTLGEVNDGATVEHISELGVGGRSGNGAAACAVAVARLQREGGVLEADVASAADEVNRSVDVAVLPVGLHAVVIAVVGVLVGEERHVLADGVVALVLETYCASVAGNAVVIPLVLEGEVLDVGVLAGVHEYGCLADSLGFGLVLDDDTLHALSDERDVVAAERGEAGGAQVVGAVGNEDEGAWSIGGCVDAVHYVDDVKEALGIAGLHEVPLSVAHVVGGGGVHNLHVVDVNLAAALHLECQRSRFALVVVGNHVAVGG